MKRILVEALLLFRRDALKMGKRFVFVAICFAQCLMWVTAQLLAILSTSMKGVNWSPTGGVVIRSSSATIESDQLLWGLFSNFMQESPITTRRRQKSYTFQLSWRASETCGRFITNKHPIMHGLSMASFHHIFRSSIFVLNTKNRRLPSMSEKCAWNENLSRCFAETAYHYRAKCTQVEV